ncbi:MAG: gliding motility lipoprotein GldH [Saprospiraceae bacterium]|nr:gliding motility lipoprotein GldH [Saprospiraceae bacterium]
MKDLSVLIILPLMIMACGKSHFYETSLEIEQSNWSYNDTLSYNVNIRDTSIHYDIGLEIVHTTDFAYQNLYIQILTVFPDGKLLSQTLPIDFADHTGLWYGKCRGETCTLKVMLQENALFNQLGDHDFKIMQYMRIDPVPGIKEVAMILDERI